MPMTLRQRVLLSIAMLILATAVSRSGWAGDQPRFTRTVVAVDVPDLTLVDQDGDHVQLRSLVLTDKPVLVEFIFATCTTICPVLSAGFASVQRKLGPDADSIALVSITIDPEHDVPEEMKAYLGRYGAKPGWTFLTGSRSQIDDVMRAFDAYVANKMSHRPLTFVHAPGADEWLRIEGFAGSEDLLEEVRRARGQSSASGGQP